LRGPGLGAPEVTSAGARTIAEGLQFPEGPVFDENGNLWCVELRAGCITRIGEDGILDRYPVGGRPCGLAAGRGEELWYCDGDRNEVRVFSTRSGQSWAAAGSADGQDLDAPNDLVFDGAGNLIFSCPGQSRTEPTGSIAVLAANGNCHVIARGLQFPNGLAFAPDGETLYVAETYRQRVLRGRWDADAKRWTAEEPILQTSGRGGPDGLAIDWEGRVYAAVYGGRCIMISTSAGKQAGVLSTKGQNPTNCAFDPSGDKGLVVTEAQAGEMVAFGTAPAGLALHVARHSGAAHASA
jgi:gluconolactonase